MVFFVIMHDAKALSPTLKAENIVPFRQWRQVECEKLGLVDEQTERFLVDSLDLRQGHFARCVLIAAFNLNFSVWRRIRRS